MAAPAQVEAPQFIVEKPRFNWFSTSIFLRLALLLTVAAYVPTINFDFVYDDMAQYILSPWLQQWKFVPEYFTHHALWGFGMSNGSGNYYRPMALLWERVNYAICGSTPGWWHLMAIAAHLTVVFLLFFFVRKVLKNDLAAAIAAAVFGVYPMHVESVAWMTGAAGEAVMSCMFLGALLCYLRWRDGGNLLWMLAALLLYLSACLTMENATGLPAIILCYEFLFPDDAADSFRQRLKRAILVSLPFFIVMFGYLKLRMVILGGLVDRPRPLSTLIYSLPSAVWFYLKLLFWPYNVSLLYDWNLVSHPGIANFYLPAALLIVAAIICLAAWRRAPALTFCTAFALIMLSPVLVGLLVFQKYDFVHDRYAYIPSMMVAVLFGWLLSQVGEALGAKRAAIISTALLLLLAAGTVRESRQWQDELTLFSTAADRAPHNALARDYKARALYGVRRVDDSIRTFQEVLQIDPGYWPAAYNIGLMRYQEGRYVDAEQAFTQAIQIRRQTTDKEESQPLYYLGLARLRQNKFAEAEPALRRAVELKPNALGYHLALGSALEGLGRQPEAAEQFEAEKTARATFQEKQKTFETQASKLPAAN